MELTQYGFDKLSTKWQKVLLDIGITNIANSIPTDIEISPAKSLVFEAFKYSSGPEDIKCILVGQDPYPTRGNAMGLAFSVFPGIKVPASLKPILKITGNEDSNGDISPWAKRGCLLINTYLTIPVGGKGKEHASIWKTFLPSLFKAISNKTMCCILLGIEAHKYESSFAGTVLKWGHPSPLNRHNSDTTNPAAFIHCTCFKKATELCGIEWSLNDQTITGSVVIPLAPKELIVSKVIKTRAEPSCYLFTDGGAIANGKITCKSSYAFRVIGDAKVLFEHGARVPGVAQSNNIGELTGIDLGLKELIAYTKTTNAIPIKSVLIVSDSEYSIKCCSIWIHDWIKKGLLGERKNIDLILNIKKTIESAPFKVYFKHTYSHKERPTDAEDIFFWEHNCAVDLLCTNALK